MFVRQVNPVHMIVCVLVCVSGLSADADNASQGVLDDAVSGWRRIKQKLSPATGIVTEELETVTTDAKNPSPKREIVSKKSIQFWLTDDSSKATIDSFDQSGKWSDRLVVGTNPEYAYKAAQKTKDGPYFVTECGVDKEKYDHIRSTLQLGLLIHLEHAYSDDSDWESLLEIIKRDSFKLISTREVVENGHNYIEIKFEVMPAQPVAKRDPVLREVTLVVDPAADWRVVKSSTNRGKRETSMEVNYQADGVCQDMCGGTWTKQLNGDGPS